MRIAGQRLARWPQRHRRNAGSGSVCESSGYVVSFERIEGSAGGWCDPKNKRIVVDADVPANAQLRTLIR